MEDGHSQSEVPRHSMRKTRFVLCSDTHNASPGGAFTLPKGDVLIHAGDMTNQGSCTELKKTIKWIEEAPFEAKIIIAGNHDITLDKPFFAQYGLYFHNQNLQDPDKCQALLEESPSILWLKHEAAVIHLVSPKGPRTTFKIFGSPYSPAKGMWAFGYEAGEAAQIWSTIPLDCDIVLTHTPPKYHCDETKERRAAGCEELRKALWRIRPRLAICGHVHEGRGVDRVRWDLGDSNVKYKESNVEHWEDPGRGNKKLSLVDLTSTGRNSIQNDGSKGDHTADIETPGNATGDVVSRPGDGVIDPDPSSNSKSSTIQGLSQITASLLAVPEGLLPPATRGQGGIPPSQRCDLAALSGRLGRKETCIINAAIMASSWPRVGGKQYNKPIVVDIDLPVWEE